MTEPSVVCRFLTFKDARHVKVVFAGEPSVPKSRLLHAQEDIESGDPIIYKTVVDNANVIFHLYDFCDQDPCKSSYQNADVLILAFDLSRSRSSLPLAERRDRIRSICGAPFILLGVRTMASLKGPMTVELEEISLADTGEKLAAELGADKYVEVDESGQNKNELLKSVVEIAGGVKAETDYKLELAHNFVHPFRFSSDVRAVLKRLGYETLFVVPPLAYIAVMVYFLLANEMTLFLIVFFFGAVCAAGWLSVR